MKKLIMTAAVVACASIVSAQVPSDNVVGYVKETTPAAGGFNIVNVNVFGTADIQDVIANVADLNASTIKANADKIYVWSGTGYSSYGLYAGTSDYWMDTLSIGWNKAAKAAPSAVTLNRGNSVWYETGAGGVSAPLYTLGEVPNDGTFDIAVANFSLIAYPYAATINLTDLVVSNATASATKAVADKIYIWSGTGYSSYGLYAGTSDYWMDTLSIGWNKAAKAAPSDVDVDLGKGIWYESPAGAKTIGFTQNYNVN